MLKKAGIVAATSAAALVALSPLAFAAPSAGCEFGSQGASNAIEQASESGDTTSFTGDVAGGAGANSASIVNGQSQSPDTSCNTAITETNTSVEDNDTIETITDSYNEATSETITDVVDLDVDGLLSDILEALGL